MAKKNKVFPVFAVTVLVLAILWILAEVGVWTVNVPWFPIIIAAIAIGWILDFYGEKK